MEKGMRRRKTVYDEFKDFNENKFNVEKAFKKDQRKSRLAPFMVHGKLINLPMTSFYIFGKSNRFRKFLIWLYTWK